MNPTDTQRALLKAAAAHPQRKLTDFPANLHGGARGKVLAALCKAQWIEPADPAAEEHTITQAGIKAIGEQAQPQDTVQVQVQAQATKPLRKGTKQAVLIELLSRTEGATLPQMVEVTGWQAHTVRGAMAGALKRKLGLHLTSEKRQDQERVYRITNQPT